MIPPRGSGDNPSAPADGPDSELLQTYTQFCSAHAALDRLLASEEDPPDEEGLARHREWQHALNRGLSMPAVTPAGKQAKAAMLLAAISVILGTDERDVLPRELIAC